MPTLSRAMLALAPFFSIAIACSSTTPTVDAGPGPELCPSTIAEATATPMGDAGEGVTNQCHVPGYVCVVGFPCGSFIQQAACVCTAAQNGTSQFVCTLEANGMAVPAGTTDTAPLCTSTEQDAQPTACPTDDTMASGTSCNTSGEQCFYQGKSCPGQLVPPTDTCQCVAAANGDAGLVWACDIHNCL